MPIQKRGNFQREKIRRFVDGHGQDISDGSTIVADLEGGGIVALSVAAIAVGPGGGEEIHLKLDAAVSPALGALSPRIVKGKTRGIKPSQARLRQLGEELADVVEDLDVGGGAGTGGLADG